MLEQGEGVCDQRLVADLRVGEYPAPEWRSGMWQHGQADQRDHQQARIECGVEVATRLGGGEASGQQQRNQRGDAGGQQVA
ncbi:hypothetical protein D9M68_528850 [compost metagenome]